jgi:hypothetical protein
MTCQEPGTRLQTVQAKTVQASRERGNPRIVLSDGGLVVEVRS